MIENSAVQTVNWPLFRARSLQFMYYFAAGAALPYFPVYYYAILTDSGGQALAGLIGTLMALQSIMGIFSPPLAGMLSDKFRIHKRMLSICALIAGISALVIASPGFHVSKGITPALIAMLFVAVIIHGFSIRPLIPLIDTESLNDLRAARGDTKTYGSVRMFGSIAWTISAILGGFLLYATRPPNSAMLLYAAGFIILGLVTARGINARVDRIKIPWHELLRDKRFFLFLFFIFISALAISSSYAFTGVYMQEQNLSTVVIGIALGASALIEVPLFFIAPRLLQKLGDKWMMVTGTLLQMLKLLLFSTMDSGTGFVYFIAVQLSHGIGYSIFFTGCIHFMDTRSHRHLKATYQSLYQMMWAGGGALGGFLIPFMIAAKGSAWMMGIFSIVMGFGSLFAALVFKNSKA